MVYFMAEGFFFTPVNQKEMSSFKLQFDLIQILTFPCLYLKKQLTYIGCHVTNRVHLDRLCNFGITVYRPHYGNVSISSLSQAFLF